MTRLSLTVGKIEKHNVEVLASLRGTQVHIDGKPVSTFNSSAKDKMTRFAVGEKEPHDLEVKVRGYILHKIDVLVDGKSMGSG